METTRILKRIVFINIANTDYSSAEINGNTCFVGTNNLGKTTLQRAILFFYNANTRGLGITSSQRSFEDYYFQYPNSYIIYEIATENGAFHVMLYRNNKICYRFVDAEYNPDNYIVNDEALMLKDVLYKFNENNIFYSDQIDTFERYRNIIYGADPDKRYKPFSLMKGNNLYHNIPLAIQAIFLSSESVIKAEFVKDCIANSISTKHTTIELKTIERQLRQFSERYQDIETFFRKENSNRGNLIKDNFHLIKNLKQKQRGLASELGSSLKFAEEQKENLEKALEEKRLQIDELQKGFEEKEKGFRERIEEVIGEKAVYRKKLEEAEKKQKDYDRKNIHELIRLSEGKPQLQSELKARESEYLTLTASFQDAEQQYKTLLDAIENERKDFENGIAGLGLKLDKEFQEDKSVLMENLQQEKDDLRDKHQADIENLKEDLNNKNLELKDIEFQIRELKKKQYFETEVKLIKKQIQEIKEKKHSRKSAIQNCQNKLETLKKEGEYLREKYDISFEQFKKENRQEILATEDAIAEIDQKLSAHQGAFFGFLQENHPGWMETIGKVCHEELLYKKTLNPKLLKENLDSLYGIQLDLAEVDVQCRSLEQLEQEKQENRLWISEKQQQFLDFQESHEKELQSKLATIGRKAGQLKQDLEQHSYEAEQDEQKEKQLELDLMDWERKGEQQKEIDTTALYVREQDLQKEREEFKKQLERLTETYEQALEEIKGKYNNKLYLLKQEFDKKADELSAMKEEKVNTFNKRREKLEKEKTEHLKEKGIDDAIIKQLKQEVKQLQDKLESIEKNAQLVSEYKKDKRELFDHIDKFIREKEQLEVRQEEEQQRLKSAKALFEKEKDKLKEEKGKLSESHRKFKDGLDHFNKFFKEKSLYDRLRHIIENSTATQTNTNLIDVCSQLLANDAEYHKQFQSFRNQITDFVGRFRPENHFNFKVSTNASESEYEHFANQLQDFYNENRIQISIAEVAKSHGMLIDAIATKVKTLTDHKGRINRMVAKMENDFSKASFESSQLIEYIRLKSEDSENKVLRKLQKIAEFREQNPFIYGESNLFNTDAKGKMDIDRKSVELLNELLRSIAEENYDEIRVQDLFELRFRIKEGKNDTGWIEKIDKVGSTGTDMLVKAVIYITLLNVFIKESTDRTAQSFKVHCIIDEVGQISAPYLKELINFAEDRNIYLINGLPNESKLETHYNFTYKFRKNSKGNVKIIPLLSISVGV